MKKFLIIIVTGLPGSGKTTLSKKLSEKLSLPVINKDAMKELLFDSLGWKDREWSKKLGMATFGLLYYIMEAQMMAGKTFIVESNFKHEFDSKKFLALKKKYNFFPIQIVCEAKGEIIFRRFKKRHESGNRHPGHRDEIVCEEYRDDLLKGSYQPLKIGGKIIKADTTSFQSADVNKLIKEISLALK
ncbi:MAG: AAA family ATPase [Candidatus Moranbacteria bacterium]|nr:AAA family ATPase [Candidatus Moranbacteria bacterium]